MYRVSAIRCCGDPSKVLEFSGETKVFSKPENILDRFRFYSILIQRNEDWVLIFLNSPNLSRLFFQIFFFILDWHWNMYWFNKILFELFCKSDFFSNKNWDMERISNYWKYKGNTSYLRYLPWRAKQNQIDQLKSIFNNENFRQFYRKNMMYSNNRSKTRKFQELFTLFQFQTQYRRTKVVNQTPKSRFVNKYVKAAAIYQWNLILLMKNARPPKTNLCVWDEEVPRITLRIFTIIFVFYYSTYIMY